MFRFWLLCLLSLLIIDGSLGNVLVEELKAAVEKGSLQDVETLLQSDGPPQDYMVGGVFSYALNVDQMEMAKKIYDKYKKEFEFDPFARQVKSILFSLDLLDGSSKFTLERFREYFVYDFPWVENYVRFIRFLLQASEARDKRDETRFQRLGNELIKEIQRGTWEEVPDFDLDLEGVMLCYRNQ